MMHASRPPRSGRTRPPRALPALALVALLLAPAASRAAGAGESPAPPPVRTGGGHLQPAPVAAYDTLRHGEVATDRAVAVPVEPEESAAPAALPLLLDTNDFGFGTSVLFARLPSIKDIGDLATLTAVQHVVVALPEWPAGYEALQPLGQAILPEGADLIVVLPGYPPTHAAAEAWNYLRLPLRLVLVVSGPPGNRAGIDELNRIRGLERVIADMEYPSRTGFERLQRPLSFRVVRR